MRRLSGIVSVLIRGDLTVMADRRGDVDATLVEITDGATGFEKSWQYHEDSQRDTETRTNGESHTRVCAHVINGQRLPEQFVR